MATSGMIVLAWAPTNMASRPRTLRDGRAISAMRVAPPPSTDPIWSCSRRSSSSWGYAANASSSAGPSGTTSSSQPSTSTSPSGPFIVARSCARRMAGFGAQLP